MDHAVEIRDLVFSYRAPKPVLKIREMVIAKGEKVFLHGPSGSERVEAIVLVFLLTATNALFRFRNVFILCIKKSRNLSRFLSAAILLFLFFLPLHIHFPANPQVSEDCACCYFGGRVQMDLAPAAVILGPSDEVSFLILRITEAPIQVIIKSELARAPPYSLAS